MAPDEPEMATGSSALLWLAEKFAHAAERVILGGFLLLWRRRRQHSTDMSIKLGVANCRDMGGEHLARTGEVRCVRDPLPESIEAFATDALLLTNGLAGLASSRDPVLAPGTESPADHAANDRCRCGNGGDQDRFHERHDTSTETAERRLRGRRAGTECRNVP